MQTDGSISTKTLWVGRIASAIPVLLILFAAILKLFKAASVVQGLAQQGYSEHLVASIGVIELACTVVYMIPRTSVLGAILLTGFLGGATATTVRVGDPSFLLPVFLGMLVWVGLYFRDIRLRALIPLRN
jgi:hypothetical protein